MDFGPFYFRSAGRPFTLIDRIIDHTLERLATSSRD